MTDILSPWKTVIVIILCTFLLFATFGCGSEKKKKAIQRVKSCKLENGMTLGLSLNLLFKEGNPSGQKVITGEEGKDGSLTIGPKGFKSAKIKGWKARRMTREDDALVSSGHEMLVSLHYSIDGKKHEAKWKSSGFHVYPMTPDAMQFMGFKKVLVCKP